MSWQRLEKHLKLYRTWPIGPKGNKATGSYQELQKRLQCYQRHMRQKPTYAEIRFKKVLCEYFDIKHNTKRYKSLIRQQGIFIFNHNNKLRGYIADFYLPRHRIIFEIDGDSHDSEHAKAYDSTRSYLLRTRDIKVFRIKNTATKDKTKTTQFIHDAITGNLSDTPNKPIAKPISREQELKMQEDFIKSHGITKCRPKYKGKAP